MWLATQQYFYWPCYLLTVITELVEYLRHIFEHFACVDCTELLFLHYPFNQTGLVLIVFGLGPTVMFSLGAGLEFYKGGYPIYLKGALPPNYFDPCYLNQTIFLALEEIVGARRSYDI